MKKLFYIILVSNIVLFGCSPGKATSIPTQLLPINNMVSPTVESIMTASNTPEPSLTPTRLEPLVTPTMEEIPAESDLDPVDTKSFSGIYKFGSAEVKVAGVIITDQTFSIRSTGTSIPTETGIQMVAELWFYTWWKAQEKTSLPTDADKEDFYRKWATAQSPDAAEGEKEAVEAKILANDVRTEGYVQREYRIRFMNEPLEGNTDSNIRYIDTLGVAFTGQNTENSTDVFYNASSSNLKLGTNLDGNTLLFYVASPSTNHPSRLSKTNAELIASMPWWFTSNTGKESVTTDNIRIVTEISDHLKKGGFRVFPR